MPKGEIFLQEKLRKIFFNPIQWFVYDKYWYHFVDSLVKLQSHLFLGLLEKLMSLHFN